MPSNRARETIYLCLPIVCAIEIHLVVLIDIEKIQPGDQMLDLAGINDWQQGNALWRIVLMDNVPASLFNVCCGFQQLDEIDLCANGDIEYY